MNETKEIRGRQLLDLRRDRPRTIRRDLPLLLSDQELLLCLQNHRQIPPPRLYRPRVPRQVPNHSDPRSLHPNIVQIHEAFDSDDSLTMVLNLCRVQDGCCQTIIYIYI
ncbi:hypothetical protein LINPERPRIM_LOCUS21823 [Linum perenne]